MYFGSHENTVICVIRWLRNLKPTCCRCPDRHSRTRELQTVTRVVFWVTLSLYFVLVTFSILFNISIYSIRKISTFLRPTGLPAVPFRVTIKYKTVSTTAEKPHSRNVNIGLKGFICDLAMCGVSLKLYAGLLHSCPYTHYYPERTDGIVALSHQPEIIDIYTLLVIADYV